MRRELPKTNQIEFYAFKGSSTQATIHVMSNVDRSSVYYIRRLVRRFNRKGYRTHVYLNHNGKIIHNVFGADIYTRARIREEQRAKKDGGQ